MEPLIGLDWQFDLVVSHALFSRKWRDPATDGAARRRRLRLLGKVHRRGQLRRRRIRPKSEKYVAMGLISDLDMSSTSDNSFARRPRKPRTSSPSIPRRLLQDTAGEDAGATDAKTLMEIWAFAKPQSAPPSSPTQLCQLEVSLKLCFRHIFNEDKLNKFRKSLCPFI